MRNRLIEQEILVTSEYVRAISSILSRKEEISLVKVVFFAFILKKKTYYAQNVFSGKNSKDLVLKCIAQLAGQFHEFCKAHEYIFMALHLLVTNEAISVEGETVKRKNDFERGGEWGPFLEGALDASHRFSNRQFTKELMRHV